MDCEPIAESLANIHRYRVGESLQVCDLLHPPRGGVGTLHRCPIFVDHLVERVLFQAIPIHGSEGIKFHL